MVGAGWPPPPRRRGRGRCGTARWRPARRRRGQPESGRAAEQRGRRRRLRRREARGEHGTPHRSPGASSTSRTATPGAGSGARPPAGRIRNGGWPISSRPAGRRSGVGTAETSTNGRPAGKNPPISRAAAVPRSSGPVATAAFRNRHGDAGVGQRQAHLAPDPAARGGGPAGGPVGHRSQRGERQRVVGRGGVLPAGAQLLRCGGSPISALHPVEAEQVGLDRQHREVREPGPGRVVAERCRDAARCRWPRSARRSGRPGGSAARWPRRRSAAAGRPARRTALPPARPRRSPGPRRRRSTGVRCAAPRSGPPGRAPSHRPARRPWPAQGRRGPGRGRAGRRGRRWPARTRPARLRTAVRPAPRPPLGGARGRHGDGGGHGVGDGHGGTSIADRRLRPHPLRATSGVAVLIRRESALDRRQRISRSG